MSGVEYDDGDATAAKVRAAAKAAGWQVGVARSEGPKDFCPNCERKRHARLPDDCHPKCVWWPTRPVHTYTCPHYFSRQGES